jgi:SET domain-containing protein
MFQITEAGVKGKGAFATTDIPKGTLIGEYTGEVIDEAEADRRYENSERVYLFTVEGGKYVDGDDPKNLLKYVNHSCNPNCEADIKGEKVFYHALRDIKKGEELTIDYSLDAEPNDPQTCLCGEPNCRGTMKEAKEA